MSDDFSKDFETFLVSMGATPGMPVYPDGIRRYWGVGGKTRGGKFGYCLHWNDGTPLGWGCNYTTNAYDVWNPCKMSREELERTDGFKDKAARLELEKSHARHRAAAIAEEIFAAASPAASHSYLKRKGIQPFVLRMADTVHGKALIVPIKSIEGDMKSLQFIYDHGKRYLSNGEIRNNFYTPYWFDGPIFNRGIFCEGMATAHSIYGATGIPTIATMDVGNLPAVVGVWRGRFPGAKFYIAADDDWKRKGGNIGVTVAKQVAGAYDARVLIPEFHGERGDKETDFNDVHVKHGLHEVRKQIIWNL